MRVVGSEGFGWVLGLGWGVDIEFRAFGLGRYGNFLGLG